MMRRHCLLLLGAGFAALGVLLLLPRADEGPRSRAPAPPATSTGALPVHEERPPAPWAPHAPPKGAERPKPASVPLDRIARGITAASPGGDAPFVLRDRNANAFFTPQGITLALAGAPAPGAGPSERRARAVRWGLVGAAEVAPRPEGEMPGKVNRFVGDPSTWKTGQPTYSSMVYEEVRPGVDLIVESRPAAIKYTLHAERGADLGALRFRYEGAGGVRVAGDGASVEVDVGAGVLREDGLKCWQDGPEGRRDVAARYVARGRDEVEISLDGFDPDLPLTVDPVIGWSTYLGGALAQAAEDYGYSVAADSFGNAYVAGYTYSVNLPGVGVGSLSSTLQGTVDGFLMKLNSSGIQWSTYLGGTLTDYAQAVALDGSGYPVVVGYTTSPDFPTTAGAYDRIFNSTEAFVMKFDGAGALLWSTFLGGTNTDYGQAVAVDSGDYVYVGGYTFSSNFPIVGGFDATLSTTPDGFVAKLDPSGSGIEWSSYLGGNDTDYVQGIAVDGSGSTYVTGYTYSTDFTVNAPFGKDTVLGGTVDGFLAKIKPSGTGLEWSTYLGGLSSDYAYGVTVVTDVTSDPVVVGYTNSSDYPTTALALDKTYNSTEAFVTRVKANGSDWSYSTFLGGTNSDYGTGIAAGPLGSVYVTGYTYSTNLPTTPLAYQGNDAVLPDGFVARVNGTGTALDSCTYLGRNNTDVPRSIAVVTGGANDGVYIAGYTYSTDYPATPAPPLDNSLGGSLDAFASKLKLDLRGLDWSSYVGGDNSRGDDFGQAVAVDTNGNAYVTGFTTSFDFPAQSGAVPLDLGLDGTQDVFVTKVATSGGSPVIVWSTYLGGSSTEQAFGIAVDRLFYPYITGNTNSTDFPLQNGPSGGGTFDSAAVGTEAFVTCLTPDGTLFYSTYLGGGASDYGRAIAVDDSFNAYITGYTYSSTFPTLSPFDPTLTNGPDAFVVKLAWNGNGLWSSYLGGNDDDYGYGIAVDASGTAAWVTGHTFSTNLSASGIDDTLGGTVDTFVARVNTNGSLAWTRYLGGTDNDYGKAVAVGFDGTTTYLYVTGHTYSPDFPTLNAYDATDATSPDAFVARIDPTSGATTWATYLAGNASDFGLALATDNLGNVYVAGHTSSTDFPTKGAIDPTHNGSADAFVAKFFAAGGTNSLAWSTFLGGVEDEYGNGIAWAPGGVVYVTGTTYSPDFPLLSDLGGPLGGIVDAFLVRLDNSNPDAPDFSAAGAGGFKLDGVTPIPIGGWTNEASVIARAKLTHSDDEPMKLQVEIKRLTFAFTGIPDAESPAFVASGSLASATVPLGGIPPTGYHFQARAIDVAGRASAWIPLGGNSDAPLPADRDVGRDTTLPSVAVASPTMNPTYHTQSSSIALAGTSSDGDSGVLSVKWSRTPLALLPNNGSATPPLDGWSIPSIPLAVGTNVITIEATDNAGNVGTALLTVIRDNTPPTVSITIPATDPYITGAAFLPLTMQGNASDASPGSLAGVSWSNGLGAGGDATLGPGTWSALVSGLTPGLNIIEVKAVDEAGNESIDTITLNYDTTPPAVSISTPANGTITTATSIAMTGLASDNAALAPANAVTLKNLTNNFTAGTTGLPGWSSTVNLDLAAGANVLEAKATDSVGLTATTTVTVYRDITAPTVVITVPATDPFVTGSPTVSLAGTSSDDLGVQSITWSRLPATLPPNTGTGTLANPGATSSTWTISGIGLVAGANTITVTVTDSAGRTSTDTITVNTSSTLPTLGITSPNVNPKVTNLGTIGFSGTASDDVGVTSMTCTNTTTGNPFAVTPSVPLTSGPGVVFDWSATVTLQPGDNIITVTANDASGSTTASITVIYDPTVPVLKITGPTTADDYHTGIAALSLSGTVSDNRAVTSLSWTTTGAAPFSGTTPVASPWSISGINLAPGVQTITVRATDEAMNFTEDTLLVTYDPTLPDVTITLPTVAASHVTNATPIALGGTASDPAPGLLRNVTWANGANGTGGTATGTTDWSVASVTLEPGPNPITVIATDQAGNLKTDTITVYYDTALPQVTITGPSGGSSFTTNAATIALEGTASDDVGIDKVEWRFEMPVVSAWVTANDTNPWDDPAVTLVAGANLITVRVTDLVGKVGTDTITVYYDPNPPSIAVTVPAGPGPNSTTGTPMALSGTASDLPGSGPAVDVAQVVWENLTTGGFGNAALLPGTWSASVPLTSGTNSLQFTAYDAAGNSTTVTRTVIYDVAAPFVDITTPTTGLSYTTGSTPVILGGTATDDVGVVGVGWSTTGAVVPTSGSCPFTSPNWTASIPLAPGSNVITITATDGEFRTGTARITIVYDPSPPLVAITNPSAESAFLTTISPLALGGAASDNIEVQDVAWENQTTGESGPASGTGAWTISAIPLIEGPNVITVTATDGVGNTGSTTVTVTYDGTPPTVALTTIDGGPATDPFPTSTRPIMIGGTAGDNLSLTSLTWTNSLGGGGTATPVPALPATSVTWTAGVYLYPGNNLITVTATDGHGYSTTAMVTIQFTPENVAPSTQIATPSATGSAVSATQRVTVAGTADDNVAVVGVTWINQTTRVRGTATLSGGPNPVDWTGDVPLTDGPNVIVVTAVDDAGNTASATITITFTSPSDAVGPAVTITGPTLLDVWDATTSPLLMTLTAIDNVGVASVSWFNAATGGDGTAEPLLGDTWAASVALAQGANTITVTARDPAGNTATDVLIVNFVPTPGDSSNPVVTILSHPTTTTLSWGSATIVLGGTASDNAAVAAVVWSNGAGGASGSAEGTVIWTATVTLIPGINLVTVRAYDTSGNVDTDPITILYSPPPPPPEFAPAGHCGLTGLEGLALLALLALLRRRRLGVR